MSAKVFLSASAIIVLSFFVFPREVQCEIVAFTGGSDDGWESWNWTALTHLAFWTAPKSDVVAKARAYGVKLYQDAHLPDHSTWTDSSARQKFAQEKAQQVQSGKFDGVFFDYEGNSLSSDQKQAYAKLAQAVTDSLKPLNASVFVCVGGRPTYEFRDYDYKELSEASEFLFIMGYDMHLWDDYTCITKGTCSPAEAPIKDLTAGVEEYLQQVKPSKLVLGLPWYGERYKYVLGVPVPQGQIDYTDVLTVFDQKRVEKKTLDKDSQTWKIDCKGDCVHDKTGSVIWYDDAQTLAPKYHLAKDKGLLGVGMFKADDLPGDEHAKERVAMWQAISDWYK